jgi:hypothetical protein
MKSKNISKTNLKSKEDKITPAIQVKPKEIIRSSVNEINRSEN